MPRITADVELAKIAIASRGSDEPSQLLALARRLLEDNQIGYSRRVLEMVLAGPEAAARDRLEMRIELALATYKDPDLPVDERLDRALAMLAAILEDHPGLLPRQRQRCLSIAGAVHKQRWSVYGLRSHLEAARAYYLEASALGVEQDAGWSAINAAFVLDLLADQEHGPDGAPTPDARQLQQEAEALRAQVLESLGKYRAEAGFGDQYWFAATLGEACLGTGRYEAACEWMRVAAGLEVKTWQLESTARQAAHLARLEGRKHGIDAGQLEESGAWRAVQALLGDRAEAALALARGKVGLALSGGGFRASLYHIGVLARLAELDMLRHLEVLSCVSGGSILGAYYCLELKHLLESKPDEAITRDDYIELVRRIERNFLEGVQRNVRMRMLFGFGPNAKALVSRHPSTSERLGELYESELYSRVADGAGGRKRYLNDLIVRPSGTQDFRPKYDNWRRRNKVPILVLNATTLNTCHNWQFTASYMGEPPARGIDSEIDGNERLRRMYHDEAPPAWRGLRLGYAVAASACVPGLFDPLVLDRLYEDGYVTRLVDGGVFDNQGVAGLLEQDCTVLLVSDACGQIGAEKDPAAGRLAVPGRANSILMARVRETQYHLLAHARESSLVRSVLYIHLKKGLDASVVDWLDCPDPSQPKAEAVLTRYGIRKDVQKLLANIRTDLDSFSNAEADALMLSGYAMTATEFSRCVQGFPVPAEPEVEWRFRSIHKLAGNPGASPELAALKKVLLVAHRQSFKAWKLSKNLRFVRAGAVALAIGATAVLCRQSWSSPLLGEWNLRVTGRGLATLAVLLPALYFGKKHVLERWLGYRNHFSQCVLSAAACLVGWILLAVHLRFIDPVYNRCGPQYRHEAASGEPQQSQAAGSGE